MWRCEKKHYLVISKTSIGMLSGISTLRKCSSVASAINSTIFLFSISCFDPANVLCYSSFDWLRKGPKNIILSPDWLKKGPENIILGSDWLRKGAEDIILSPDWLRKGPEDIILSPDWLRKGPKDIILSPDWFDRSRPSVRVAGSSFSPDQFLYLNIAQV
jgi:hypothetical protein